MRRIWFVGALILAAEMITACATGPPSGPDTAPGGAPIEAPQRIVVGLSTDRPGLGILRRDGSNVRSGFDVDFARWLVDRAYPGFDLAEVNMTAEERVPSLAGGQGFVKVVERCLAWSEGE